MGRGDHRKALCSDLSYNLKMPNISEFLHDFKKGTLILKKMGVRGVYLYLLTILVLWQLQFDFLTIWLTTHPQGLGGT